VTALTARRHHFARAAWPAHSVGDLISKFRRLESAIVIVQALAGVALPTFVGDVIAPHNADLRGARWTR
jgi:hypothetical protein